MTRRHKKEFSIVDMCMKNYDSTCIHISGAIKIKTVVPYHHSYNFECDFLRNMFFLMYSFSLIHADIGRMITKTASQKVVIKTNTCLHSTYQICILD